MSGPWNPEGSNNQDPNQWPQSGQGGQPPQGGQPYQGQPYQGQPYGDQNQYGNQPPYGGQPQYGSQQPYGDQQGQQGWQGGPSGPANQPPQKNTGLVIGIVVALLLIAGGVTTFLLLNKDDDPSVAVDTSSSSAAPTTDSNAPSTQSSAASSSATSSSTESSSSSSSESSSSSSSTSSSEEPTSEDPTSDEPTSEEVAPGPAGSCAVITGFNDDVELVPLDCADPAAVYVVTDEGIAALCEDWEAKFTTTSSLGLSSISCLGLNLQVGECATLSQDVNTTADMKVDCAATVGVPDTIKLLFASVDTSDEAQCPAETVTVEASFLRNTLRCFATN